MVVVGGVIVVKGDGFWGLLCSSLLYEFMRMCIFF